MYIQRRRRPSWGRRTCRRTFLQRGRYARTVAAVRRSPAASFSQGAAAPTATYGRWRQERPLAPPPPALERVASPSASGLSSPARGGRRRRRAPLARSVCARARAHLGVHVNVHAPRVPGATAAASETSPSISSAPAGRPRAIKSARRRDVAAGRRLDRREGFGGSRGQPIADTAHWLAPARARSQRCPGPAPPGPAPGMER